jgi:hypothetical protein
LLKWNGADAWEIAASQYTDAAGEVVQLIAMRSCLLGLFAIDVGGILLRYNNVDAWEKVAPRFEYGWSVKKIIQYYHGKIYAVGDDGDLKVWDGTNNWDTDPATTPNGLACIPPYYGQGDSLFVFLGYLYSCDNDYFGGYPLYRFDGTTWNSVVAYIGADPFTSMVNFGGTLYGVDADGNLYAVDFDAGTATIVADYPYPYETGNLLVHTSGVYAKSYNVGAYKWSSSALKWVQTHDRGSGQVGPAIIANGYIYYCTYVEGELYRAPVS